MRILVIIIMSIFVQAYSYCQSGSLEDFLKAGPYVKLALEQASMGNHKNAITNFGQALSILPNDHIILYSRGNSYLKTYDIENAIIDFSKCIEIDPSYEDAYFNRALAYTNLKNYKKAIKDYSKVIELNPTDSESYFKRGVLFGSLGDTTLACADIEKAKLLGYVVPESMSNLCQ